MPNTSRFFATPCDPVTLAWMLGNWGSAKSSVRRDDPAAKALLDEALSCWHALQDPFCSVLCYSSLGDWAVLQGDYATARRHFLEGPRMAAAIGHTLDHRRGPVAGRQHHAFAG